MRFIGVDGEGVNVREGVTEWDEETGEEVTTRQLVHKYVLLSVGDQSLHRDGEELTYLDIFEFLWQQHLANPRAVFVGFFLGYDFTHWFKTLPAGPAWDLLTKQGIERRKPPPDSERKFPHTVKDGEWQKQADGSWKMVGCRWEFDILGTKRFKLRKYLPKEQYTVCTTEHEVQEQIEACARGEHRRHPHPWMYVCDTGAFFQTSFMSAIFPRDWNDPIVSREEYLLIERGKDRRQDADFDTDMIQYNVLENEVLARLMTRLNEGLVSDQIKLKRIQWFGPGQAAQAWMKLIGVPTGAEVREVVPEWAREAAQKTFYGGWFEIFNHGPVPGTSYAYDIHSAYPSVIRMLPCLLHGRWTRGNGMPRGVLREGAYRAVYADLEGTDEWIGCAPHREPDGSILRPHKTRGWHWQHELDAAKRAGVLKKQKVIEWVQYTPTCDCPPPMAAIEELYLGRLAVGKKSPEGKSKKLTYNSAFGKCAQSIGEPKYSNPIYASLITAGCRTQILDAIATHPTKTNSVLMVATDGIVFKERHPTLNCTNGVLGTWEEELYENLSLFMPGLYWNQAVRDTIAHAKTCKLNALDCPEKHSPGLKSRGVRAKDLATVIDQVDAAWRAQKMGPEWRAPRIKLTIEWAQVSAKQAITQDRWFKAGMAIWNGERVLDGKIETKRSDIGAFHVENSSCCTKDGRCRANMGVRSYPYANGEEPETTYYSGTFGETLRERQDDTMGDMETPDGVVADLQSWAIVRR